MTTYLSPSLQRSVKTGTRLVRITAYSFHRPASLCYVDSKIWLPQQRPYSVRPPNAESYTEIQQIAHLLIKSSPATANIKEPFWNIAAEKFIRIIIQCLKNRNEPDKYNLASVKYWLNEYEPPSGKPSHFDKFVIESCANDPLLWQDYKGFIKGNQKSISSILMTADVALSALSNPDISQFPPSIKTMVFGITAL